MTAFTPRTTASSESADCRGGDLDGSVATAVDRWARSTAQPRWRYLDAQPRTLSHVELRDTDGDRICEAVRAPSSPLAGNLRKR